MLRFFHFLSRLVLWSVVLAVAGVLLAGAAVLFFEIRVPAWALDRLSETLSSESHLVRVEGASFRLTRGVRLQGVKVRDRRKLAARPFLSAERVDVALDLGRLPWSRATLVREVTVTGLSFPRLPEGYYIPDSVEFPGQPDFREVRAPVDVTFPELPAFRLVLERPDILSVRPTRVEVAAVTVRPKLARLSGILLHWPDRDTDMTLDGETAVDLYAQAVRGHVHGQARQRNIRPMLGALEITNSYQFVDAFTGVLTPVDATCQFDVNLVNNDLHIFLDLHPTGGRYRGVPFVDAHGLVDIRVFVRDTYQNAKIVVGPVAANFPDGKMTGTVVYENTNDVGYVSFDVESTVALSNALAVADVLTDGTLDCLQPETPPYVMLKGRMAVDPHYAATNDLLGYIQFERGHLFSLPLRKAHAKFHVRGTRVDFTEAASVAPGGGEMTGGGWVSYPDFTTEHATFGVNLAANRLTLDDLGEIFRIDTQGREGTFDGALNLTGSLGADAVRRLTGDGRLAIANGKLATFVFLSGLFDAMARIPGMETFVRKTRKAAGVVVSKASMSFKMKDGVLRSDDIELACAAFTIAARGSYDCLEDKLDFAVRVKIVKDDSLTGALKNPLLWPFSKLSSILLGFRATGTLEKPVWRYDTAILKRF